MWRLAGLFCQLSPPRSILAPPTQFSSPSCWHRVNIPGWVSELCALLITQPPAPAPPPPPPLKSQTFSNTPLHPQSDQEVASQQLTPPLALPKVPAPAPPPPPPRRWGARRVRHRECDQEPPTPLCPGPRRRPARPGPARTPLTWKPAQGPPASLLRIANRTAGVGPPAGHSSASAALAESLGPNVRRGRTGGGLSWGGGETRLSGWGGRAVGGRGRARGCTVGGGRGSGSEVSCCIKDRGGQR